MAKDFKPTNFGRYLLTDRIAVGGMAEIFAGKIFGAMGFEKPVVIKRILPQFAEDAEFLRMFVTEAKLVCHLEHPNIVQVHDLGEIDGQYYIAMEYVNGIDGRQLWRTLAKRKQRVPAILALFVVAEFLKGLDYAHRAVGADNRLLGVVHRDVSPSNVMISYRGDVKIGDFGIALVQQESKSQAGVLKGKYGYMSPEQVAGLQVDHRSDIFASGIVLAELLLGRRLFLGRSDFETLDKVLNVRLDVLDQHADALPSEIVAIVRRALQREPADRFQSAREFQEEILEFFYDQRERITSETLAAFISQHIAPFVSQRRDQRPPSTRSADDSPIGTPPGSPVLPRAVIDAQLTPSADPAIDPSPQQGEPEPPTDELFQEAVADFGQQDRFDPRAAQDTLVSDEVSVEEAPVIPSAEEGPVPAGTSIEEHYRNPDYQYGAIPQYDLQIDLEDGTSELDLEEIISEEALPCAEYLPPPPFNEAIGAVAGAGRELDLDLDQDEEVVVPPVITQEEVAVHEESAPGAATSMFSEQLPASDAPLIGVEPAFAGDLARRTAAKVLFRFAVARETGRLTLTGPKPKGARAEMLAWLAETQPRSHVARDESLPRRTCQVHLDNGQPGLVSADRSEEALVAHLLTTGAIEQRGVAKALKQNPQRQLVSALLAGGLLSPLQITRHVTAFVLDAVFDAFTWGEGQFAFYRERDTTHEAFPTGLDAFALIRRGTARLGAEALDRYFQRLDDVAISRNPMPSARIESFPEDTLLRGVYDALTEPRPLQSIIAACGEIGPPIEIKRALYLLLECELALTA